MLTTLRFSGGAACIHQEQRLLGQHLLRCNPGAVVFFQLLVDDNVTSFNLRGLHVVYSGMTLPDQELVDLLAAIECYLAGLIINALMIKEFSTSVVAIHGQEDSTLGIDDPVCTGAGGEATEDDGVDDTDPCAGQHGDGKVCRHGHMDGNPVTAFQTCGTL